MLVNKGEVASIAIPMLKIEEGLRLTPYYCSAGKLTIGYGTLVSSYPELKNRKKITEQEADLYLLKDFNSKYTKVVKLIKVELNANQLAAIMVLVYNIGISAFTTSTLLKLINNSEFDKAALQFHAWNKVTNAKGKKVANKGLTARRKREAELFVKDLAPKRNKWFTPTNVLGGIGLGSSVTEVVDATKDITRETVQVITPEVALQSKELIGDSSNSYIHLLLAILSVIAVIGMLYRNSYKKRKGISL